MIENISSAIQSDQLYLYQYKTKRLEKKLARIEQARKIRLQKYCGLIFIVMAIIAAFYLKDITASTVCIPVGIILIGSKKQIIEM